MTPNPLSHLFPAVHVEWQTQPHAYCATVCLHRKGRATLLPSAFRTMEFANSLSHCTSHPHRNQPHACVTQQREKAKHSLGTDRKEGVAVHKTKQSSYRMIMGSHPEYRHPRLAHSELLWFRTRSTPGGGAVAALRSAILNWP